VGGKFLSNLPFIALLSPPPNTRLKLTPPVI
jgi:hypothetical protein